MNKNEIRALINNPNPIIFEIGCADGKDTKEFIDVFNDINFQMFCFEPEPRNCAIFRSEIKDPRVKFFQMALGGIDSDSCVFYQSNTEYSSSLRKPTQVLFDTWPMIKFENELNVCCKTLDTFMKEQNIPFIDYIWADVQGAEDLLVIGGKDTFKNKVKYFYTEYSDTAIYENEKSLNFIMGQLPGYLLVKDYKTDALLINQRFMFK